MRYWFLLCYLLTIQSCSLYHNYWLNYLHSNFKIRKFLDWYCRDYDFQVLYLAFPKFMFDYYSYFALTITFTLYLFLLWLLMLSAFSIPDNRTSKAMLLSWVYSEAINKCRRWTQTWTWDFVFDCPQLERTYSKHRRRPKRAYR